MSGSTVFRKINILYMQNNEHLINFLSCSYQRLNGGYWNFCWPSLLLPHVQIPSRTRRTTVHIYTKYTVSSPLFVVVEPIYKH